ncbi:PAQR family membrane homeostasis protein TrhA [Lysinibacillus sp. 54212]|uniref:PAQR family membrane homeostasis protein TrhA n=1 Tax=Lysinibacillus sp. 54212 TaxID=3119829 RepID=UPI002FCBD0F3
MVQQAVVMDSAYSKKEEFWNALTHGVGCVLTIPGILLLMNKAFQEQSMLHLVSYLIFGISMMLMFLASTLYHTVPAKKSLFKKLDHSAIFLLIAGTYTPVALIAIGGKLGWTIVAIEWGLTLFGIIMKQFFVHRFKALSLITYIGMGWIAIFVYEPLIEYISMAGLVTLLLGGIFYTAGTYFYRNNKIPYNHAIWHVFVMAGCLMMYLTVYLYL